MSLLSIASAFRRLSFARMGPAMQVFLPDRVDRRVAPVRSFSGTQGGIATKAKEVIKKQYLPLTFLTTLAVGYLWPDPGVYLANLDFTKYCTFGVFIASGLLLERKEAAKALSSKGSILFGLASILVLTPLAAPLMLALPLQPSEMALGLAVFMLTPTTLATGVNLIQTARANVAMALMLTLISNFIAVFTIPLTLTWILGNMSTAVHLSPTVLLKNLTLTVLLPTLAAYSLKSSLGGAEHWVKQRRKLISNLGTMCLIMIPWMQVSKASMSGITVDPTSLAVATVAGVAAHLIFFGGNQMLSSLLRIGGNCETQQGLALRRSVVLMTSQKSVTIAIAVLAQLSSVLTPEAIGVACIPCVLVHLSQTVIDSFIASKWAETQKL